MPSNDSFDADRAREEFVALVLAFWRRVITGHDATQQGDALIAAFDAMRERAEKGESDAARWQHVRGSGYIPPPHDGRGDGVRRTFGIGADAAVDAERTAIGAALQSQAGEEKPDA